MKERKGFLQQAARTVILAALAAGTAGVVIAWTGPSAAAPGNNVLAPINTGATAQTKSATFTATDVCNGTTCLSTVANNVNTNSGRVIFGGGWQWSTVAGCYVANWITGGCSCPAYAPNARWVYYMDTNSTYGGGRGYLCSN